MKFFYQYRTSDNVQHEGVIHAASKDAAYSLLKARGIKPGRVIEAPGLANKIVGRGKRWIAIGVLAVALGVAIVLLCLARADVPPDWEERAQIYGDPMVLRSAMEDGWRIAFVDVGERWLADHAIPARKCGCEQLRDSAEIAQALQSGRARRVEIKEDDLREVVQMKRMVNGLKNEMNRYLEAGGTIELYMKRLCIRQMAEQGIYEAKRNEIKRSGNPDEWWRANQKLRAMGLPMVHEDS